MTVVEGTYDVLADASRLGFKATAFLLLPVTGMLPLREGHVVVSGGTLAGEGVADAAGVDTGIGPRDAHLRTSHYLHVQVHPDVRLRLGSTPLDAGDVTVELTARGGTLPVVLSISELGEDDGRLTLQAHGRFDRRPLGMLPPLAGVSREIELDLTVVALRRTA